MVIKVSATLSEQLTQVMPEVIERFADTFGTSPVLERIPIIVRRQIRRVKKLV